jgi:hypothetical protein
MFDVIQEGMNGQVAFVDFRNKVVWTCNYILDHLLIS